ncbi:MAG: hypothetical protein HZC12_03820 [Nitrospirae bacterium]|nr:hypothetical protein [Nitrospirota bacterium]
MKKTFAFLFIPLLLTVIVFPACSKKKVKPSEDSIMTKETLSVIESIMASYQEKDTETLRKNLSSELLDATTKELFFDKATLSFNPKWVKIHGAAIAVNMSWHGAWTVKGRELKDRGLCVFYLEGNPLRLIKIEGDIPFNVPKIQ